MLNTTHTARLYKKEKNYTKRLLMLKEVKMKLIKTTNKEVWDKTN